MQYLATKLQKSSHTRNTYTQKFTYCKVLGAEIYEVQRMASIFTHEAGGEGGVTFICKKNRPEGRLSLFLRARAIMREKCQRITPAGARRRTLHRRQPRGRLSWCACRWRSCAEPRRPPGQWRSWRGLPYALSPWLRPR